MKKYVNGQLVDCTDEENDFAEKQFRLYAIEESRRPLTESEVSRMLLTQQINTLTVDDNTALRMKEFYPLQLPIFTATKYQAIYSRTQKLQ